MPHCLMLLVIYTEIDILQLIVRIIHMFRVLYPNQLSLKFVANILAKKYETK